MRFILEVRPADNPHYPGKGVGRVGRGKTQRAASYLTPRRPPGRGKS